MSKNATSASSKILIYLLSLSGGAGRNAVNYANILVEAGYKVSLVCGTLKRESLVNDLDSRVALHVLGPQRNVLALPHLACILRRITPSEVLVIGPSNIIIFTIAAFLANYSGPVTLRVSNSPSGMQAVYPFWLRPLKRLGFVYSLRFVSRVIALTQALAAELEKVWRIPPERIYYIPNAVNVPSNLPDRTLANPPTLLCVGRFVPQKDHATLLRAFALLRQAQPCSLLLAGEGRERARLEAITHKLDIADDVTFLGYVTNVAPLYRSAWLTVLSSRHEGFPNVLIEALAHGCPIVATDCPTGPSEIINSPDIGLLAEVGNPENLAACIAEVLSQNFDSVKLRMRAESFSEDKLRDRVTALFRTMH